MKKILRQKILVFSALLAFLFSGCATILSSSSYPLSISTNPSGAKVTVTNKKGLDIFSGVTPANLTLAAGAGFFSKASYMVKMEKPGYEPMTIPVEFKVDGWYFGNIIFGGLIGILIVDPASGAMWKLDQQYINTTLIKTTASKKDPSLNVVSYNSIPSSWKSNLVKIK